MGGNVSFDRLLSARQLAARREERAPGDHLRGDLLRHGGRGLRRRAVLPRLLPGDRLRRHGAPRLRAADRHLQPHRRGGLRHQRAGPGLGLPAQRAEPDGAARRVQARLLQGDQQLRPAADRPRGLQRQSRQRRRPTSPSSNASASRTRRWRRTRPPSSRWSTTSIPASGRTTTRAASRRSRFPTHSSRPNPWRMRRKAIARPQPGRAEAQRRGLRPRPWPTKASSTTTTWSIPARGRCWARSPRFVLTFGGVIWMKGLFGLPKDTWWVLALGVALVSSP